MMLAIISFYHVNSTVLRYNRKEFPSSSCKNSINPDQKIGGDELSNEEQKEHSKKEFMINTHMEEYTKDTGVRLMNDPFYYLIPRFIRMNIEYKHPKYSRPAVICGPKYIYLRFDKKTCLNQLINILKLYRCCLITVKGLYELFHQKLKSKVKWKTLSQTREFNEMLKTIFRIYVYEKNILAKSGMLCIKIISLIMNTEMLNLLKIFELLQQMNLETAEILRIELMNLLFANCYKKRKLFYIEMHRLTYNEEKRLDTADNVVIASNLTSQSSRYVRYKKVKNEVKTVSNHEIALNRDNGSNYTSVNNPRCFAQQDVFVRHTNHVSNFKTNIDNKNTNIEDRVEDRSRKMNKRTNTSHREHHANKCETVDVTLRIVSDMQKCEQAKIFVEASPTASSTIPEMVGVSKKCQEAHEVVKTVMESNESHERGYHAKEYWLNGLIESISDCKCVTGEDVLKENKTKIIDPPTNVDDKPKHQNDKGHKKKKKTIILACMFCVVIIVLAFIITCICRWRQVKEMLN